MMDPLREGEVDEDKFALSLVCNSLVVCSKVCFVIIATHFSYMQLCCSNTWAFRVPSSALKSCSKQATLMAVVM